MKEIYVDNLKNAEIITNPFEYTTFQLFDKEFNDKLIGNYYKILSFFNHVKFVTPARKVLDIKGDTINGIDFDNYSFIKSIQPLYGFLKYYSENIINLIYEKYYDKTQNQIKFTIQLTYDTKNYKIEPHTDSNKRAATQIVYLVCDNDKDKNLGLVLYKKNLNSFESVKKVDYYPGSTINFKVTPDSYHAVERIDTDCNRMSIQTIIWK